MSKRQLTLDTRIRQFGKRLDEAFDILDTMPRDEALYQLGGVAGRISHVRHRLQLKVLDDEPAPSGGEASGEIEEQSEQGAREQSAEQQPNESAEELLGLSS